MRPLWTQSLQMRAVGVYLLGLAEDSDVLAPIAAEDFFEPVSGPLPHPPVGFSSVSSFKTDDSYDNLQLTFFMNDSGDCIADIDIADAAGIGHVCQVLRNKIIGWKPQDIRRY